MGLGVGPRGRPGNRGAGGIVRRYWWFALSTWAWHECCGADARRVIEPELQGAQRISRRRPRGRWTCQLFRRIDADEPQSTSLHLVTGNRAAQSTAKEAGLRRSNGLSVNHLAAVEWFRQQMQTTGVDSVDEARPARPSGHRHREAAQTDDRLSRLPKADQASPMTGSDFARASKCISEAISAGMRSR